MVTCSPGHIALSGNRQNNVCTQLIFSILFILGFRPMERHSPRPDEPSAVGAVHPDERSAVGAVITSR